MELFYEEPLIVSICGPRKSGKSYFVKTLLTEGLDKYYDEIHVLCQSLDLNNDYAQFMKKAYRHRNKFHWYSEFDQNTIVEIFKEAVRVQKNVINAGRRNDLVFKTKQPKRKVEIKKKKRKLTKKKVEQLPEFQEDPVTFFTHENLFFTSLDMEDKKHIPNYLDDKPKSKKILIIMDDVVDSGVLNFHSAIDMLAMRGRHAEVTAIVNSQRIAPVSVNVRDNSDLLILFCPFSVQELESAIDKFIPKNFRKQIRKQLEDIFETEYEFLIINNTKKSIYTKMGHSNTDAFIKNKIEYLDLRDFMDKKYETKHY